MHKIIAVDLLHLNKKQDNVLTITSFCSIIKRKEVIRMDKKDFGARLLALRKQKGVSQAEVAEYIGLTVAAYQNYENGRREAGYETISKLADFYHVSIDYLFGKDAIAEPNDPIKDMSDRMNLNPYERAIISAYLAMDSKSREDLAKMIGDVAESIKSGTEYEKTYTMHIDPKEKQN